MHMASGRFGVIDKSKITSSSPRSSSVAASTGVNSRIQDNGARISASVLRQEAHVALEERTDLVDAVTDHGDPLEPEAEGHGGYACSGRVLIDWIASDDAEGLL